MAAFMHLRLTGRARCDDQRTSHLAAMSLQVGAPFCPFIQGEKPEGWGSTGKVRVTNTRRAAASSEEVTRDRDETLVGLDLRLSATDRKRVSANVGFCTRCGSQNEWRIVISAVFPSWRSGNTL